MGDLPAVRVTKAFPFEWDGLDYAGPFLTKPANVRSQVSLKTCLVVFVCFTTTAIHVELVSDLSTKAFLAALCRFVAHCGLPPDVYLDCGRNFITAAAEIQRLVELVPLGVREFAQAHKIKWHFIVSYIPHRGGL